MMLEVLEGDMNGAVEADSGPSEPLQPALSTQALVPLVAAAV